MTSGQKSDWPIVLCIASTIFAFFYGCTCYDQSDSPPQNNQNLNKEKKLKTTSKNNLSKNFEAKSPKNILSESVEEKSIALPRVPQLRSYNPLCSIEPNNSKANKQISEAILEKIRQGKIPPPENLIEDCLISREEMARVYNSGGLNEYQQGRIQVAALLWSYALIAEPRHAPSRYNLACALALMERDEEAMEQIYQFAFQRREIQYIWLNKSRRDEDLERLRKRWDYIAILLGVPPSSSNDRLYPLLLDGAGALEPTGTPQEIGSVPLPTQEKSIGWEPIKTDWENLRGLLLSNFVITDGHRKAFQPGRFSRADIRGWPSLASKGGLTPLSTAGWWKPEIGTTYLLIPYTVAGYNGYSGLAYFRKIEDFLMFVYDSRNGQFQCDSMGSTVLTKAYDEVRTIEGCSIIDYYGRFYVRVRHYLGKLRFVRYSTTLNISQ